MKQLFLSDECFLGIILHVQSPLIILFNVHRTRVKERLIVTESKRYIVQITEVSKTRININVESEKEIIKTYPEYTLFQALPKQDKMTTIIDYTVQLGVSSICPVKTDRSEVKWDSKKELKHQQRWIAKAESAAIQSKRDYQPNILPVCSLNQLHERIDLDQFDMLVVPWEESVIVDSLSNDKNQDDLKKIGIFIGPEGGLSEKEILFLKDHGFSELSLGESILRVEIAAVVALAQLKFVYR